jgi:hypothetical protein
MLESQDQKILRLGQDSTGAKSLGIEELGSFGAFLGRFYNFLQNLEK